MVDGSGRMGSPAVLDRTGLIETFREPVVQHQLSAARWIEHYLPHWTTPDRWAARFEVGSTGIRFRIDADQLPWRAEDGEMRCSCLQTGVFAGPVGSEAGQHRYRDGLLVRSASPTRHLFTPSAGIVDAVMRAVPDPSVMLAVWLVGIEDRSPDDSGEICIAELFGKAFGPGGLDVSMGIQAHNDPRLREDMVRPRLALDATAWHRYTTEWNETGIRIHVDDRLVFHSDQVIADPQAITIGLFEFPDVGPRDPATYPRTGTCERSGAGGAAEGIGVRVSAVGLS